MYDKRCRYTNDEGCMVLHWFFSAFNIVGTCRHNITSALHNNVDSNNDDKIRRRHLFFNKILSLDFPECALRVVVVVVYQFKRLLTAARQNCVTFFLKMCWKIEINGAFILKTTDISIVHKRHLIDSLLVTHVDKVPSHTRSLNTNCSNCLYCIKLEFIILSSSSTQKHCQEQWTFSNVCAIKFYSCRVCFHVENFL